jgi:hypothetical protein
LFVFVLFCFGFFFFFKEKFFVVESGEAREKLKTDRGGRGGGEGGGAGSTSRKQLSRDHSVTGGMRTVDLCSGFKSS